MPTATFDTLKFVNRLKAAGIPEAQAEAMSEAIKEAQATADVMTKAPMGWFLSTILLRQSPPPNGTS
jgi:hypothetical protein